MNSTIYNKLDTSLSLLTPDTLRDVEGLAAGMNEAEICDYLCIDIAELQHPNCKVDLTWFNKAFKRGRALAKHAAVGNLFTSMKGNQGTVASLSYLKRFATEWKRDAEIDDTEGTQKGMAFEVILGAPPIQKPEAAQSTAEGVTPIAKIAETS